jgi:acyl-CoA thioesterase-2
MLYKAVIVQVMSSSWETAYERSRRPAHSLHAYFQSAGTPHIPIDYEVLLDRDGGSFSTRRVTALQDGKPILILSASFHAREQGFQHQPKMPDVSGADGLENDLDFWRRKIDTVPADARPYFLRNRPMEVRAVPAEAHGDDPDRSLQYFWFRANGTIPSDQGLQQSLLAFSTDMKLLGAALRPHGLPFVSKHIRGASLDHAIWYHRPVDLNGWMLYVQSSPWAGGGCGLTQGAMFSAGGDFLASIAQEG